MAEVVNIAAKTLSGIPTTRVKYNVDIATKAPRPIELIVVARANLPPLDD
jgi:hypothetical protein